MNKLETLSHVLTSAAMFNAFAEQGLMGTTGHTRSTWNLVSKPLRLFPWILQDPEDAFEPLPPPFHRKHISSPASCSPHSILKIFFNKSDVSVVRLQFSDALINACLIAKTLQLFHRELLELGFACPVSYTHLTLPTKA